MTSLILLAVFMFGSFFCIAIWLFVEESRFMKKRAAIKRLLFMSSATTQGQERIQLYRQSMLEDANPLVRQTYNMAAFQRLGRALQCAGLNMPPSLFALLCVLATASLTAAAFLVSKKPAYAFLAGMVGLAGPYFFLQIRISGTREKFLELFPDALDLLSRALRAGHALSSGLAMVSEEMGQPIKDEFATVVDELKFGLSFKDAFLDLCERMPLTDLKFFSVAMLIQRDTGGNIAEIMGNISNLIRSRLKFRRHVKTLTAEGRMSGYVLVGLPICMFAYLYFANYDYVSLLWRDPLGPFMLGGGILLQVIGSIAIWKITDIEL